MSQTSINRGRGEGVPTAIAGFILLSILFTWPLATAASSRVIGHVVREAVPPLNTWAMATVWRNLFTRPGALLQGTAFYPYDNSVAFSEHLLVPALMAGPIAALTGNWTLAYNVSIFTALVLAALFMFLLARELGASNLGAFLGGGLYAFNTWNINEVVRSQILSNEFFPLVVLTCVRYARSPSWSRAAGVGMAALLQALSCMYWAVYLPFLILPVAFALVGPRLRSLWRLLVALGLAGVLVLAVTWPYVQHGRAFGLERDPPESVPVERYLQVAPQNVIYESLLGHGLANQNAAHFPGFLALLLCVPGLRALARDQPALTVALVGLGAFSFAASLGPEMWMGGHRLGPGLYQILFDHVPLFRQIRYPERFAIFVTLAISVLVSVGLASVSSRSRGLAIALTALGLSEHLSIPQLLDEMPPAGISSDVYAAIGKLPQSAVVAEIPASRYRMERLDAASMFYSIRHQRRILEGFTGYFPPLYSLAKWHLFHFPDERSVRFLSDFGITTIIDRSQTAVPASVSVVGEFGGGVRLLQLPPPSSDSFMGDSFPSRPELEELSRDSWDVRLPERDDPTRNLIDGDPHTRWSTGENLTRGTFIRVRFRSPERLGRIRLYFPLPAEFPTGFRVEGVVDDDGPTPRIPFDTDWAYASLARSLWKTPRTAHMDIDIEPTVVSGFRLRVVEDEPFRIPITISEIRAYRAR